MRAVNLIPGESRRGSGGIGPFVLIGVLALALAGAVGYVLTHNTVVDRRAQLASLQTQQTMMQTQAARVQPYREFASMADARVATVRALGAARFDWQQAFRQLATVLPDNVWLSSLLGTVAPGVSVDGGGAGSTSTLRALLPNPAIEMTGCTTDQDSVARLISRLRLMSGVVRVSLADSTKPDTSTGSGGAPGSGAGDCTHGHANFPKFDVVIFFEPLPAVPTAPSTGTTATADAGAAPAAATGTATTSTEPAASTTPAPSGDSGTNSATGSSMR